MFSGTSRPTLSRGALRVLYQLAYISSGTAVGVAALCAEERRRRTVIVQRIAENAKRLRQSPRHVHNAAAAAAAAVAAPTQDEGSGHEQEGVGDEGDEGVAVRRKVSALASRTSTLPSEVEKGYAKLAERKENRRKEGDERNGGASSSSAVRSTGSAILHPESSEPAPPLRHAPLAGREDRDLDKPRLGDTAQIMTRQRSEDQRRHRSGLNGGDPRENATVSRADGDGNGRQAFKDALSVTREGADFNSVQREIIAMLRAGTLIRSDIQMLLRASRKLSASEAQEANVIELFEKIVKSPDVRKMPRETQICVCLELAAQSTYTGATVVSRKSHAATLLTDVMSRMIADEADFIDREVGKTCHELLVAGDVSHASIFIMGAEMAIDATGSVQDIIHFPKAWKTVFSAAFAAGDHSSCASLLRDTIREESRGKFVACLQEMMDVLDIPDARGILRHLLASLAWAKADPQLDLLISWIVGLGEPVKLLFAKASIGGSRIPWQLLEPLYDSLSNVSRAIVETLLVKDGLQTSWKRTRNFDHVWMDYEAAKRLLARSESSAPSYGIDVAMIEICNKAAQSERALDILAQITKDNTHSTRSLSVAASSLAKRGFWSQLDKLVELLGRSKDGAANKLVSRNLNNVIRIYSVQHTVTETWDFVASLMDRCGFKPTRGTSQLMLNLCVKSRKLELITKWFKDLRARGYECKMDSQLALSLVWTYYIEGRPPHSLFMWLCRALLDRVPSLKSEGFQLLVKEAIAYDLKTVSRLTLTKTELNLDRVLAAVENRIPNAMNTYEVAQVVAHRRWMQQQPLPTQILPQASAPEPSTPYAPVSVSDDGTAKKVPDRTQRSSSSTMVAVATPVPMKEQSMGGSMSQDAAFVVHLTAAREENYDDLVRGMYEEGNFDHTSHEIFRSADRLLVDDDEQSTRWPNASSETSLREVAEVRSALHPDLNHQKLSAGHLYGLEGSEEAHGASSSDLSKGSIIEEANPPNTTIGNNSSRSTAQDTANVLDRHSSGHSDDRAEKNLEQWEGEGSSERLDTSNTLQRRLVERHMMLAFSLKQYQSVLSLYQRSLTPGGLPASRVAFEMAIEASLREQNDDPEEAEDMIAKARAAGMNVTCAMGPMLLHQMYRLPRDIKLDYDNMQKRVIEYYRTNEQNGWPVKHHVAVTAANILIDNDRSLHAIRILKAIHKSDWAIERPLDIVTMTVYLKGYAALEHGAGVVWVVNKVLQDNIRIDNAFLEALKYAKVHFGAPQQQDVVRFLVRSRVRCMKRRYDQGTKTKIYGRKLIKTIKLAARESDLLVLPSTNRGPPVRRVHGKASETIFRPTLSPSEHDSPQQVENPPHVPSGGRRAVEA